MVTLSGAIPGGAEPGVAEPGGSGSGSTSGPIVLVRRPYLEVLIDGVQQHRAIAARCSFSFDQRFSTCDITFQGASE